jgi:hypothetical protein
LSVVDTTVHEGAEAVRLEEIFWSDPEELLWGDMPQLEQSTHVRMATIK